MTYTSDGLKQGRGNSLYMQLRARTTMRIKKVLTPLIAAREPFDLRPSAGHLWLWEKGKYVAQKCYSGCSVCNE